MKKVEEERETTKAGTCWLSEEGETAEAKFRGAEQENERLKKEIEELRVRFTAQKKELEDEYQKQVDDMFFFGYQCCMKKNDITQDTPSYPSDGEDAAVSGLAQGDKDPM